MSAYAGVDQFNALIGTTLSRGKIQVQPISAGATATMDAPVGGSDFITVEVEMTGGASGDLTISCLPYEADGVTLMPISLPPVPNVGYAPTFNAGKVFALQEYNVQGIDKVQIQLKNNNVGAQTINRASWRTESF